MVAIGKVERWKKSTTLWATAISGGAHVASTILVGMAVGWAGYRLSSSYNYITAIAAPAILVLLGMAYIIRNFWHHKPHTHYGENPAPNTPFATVVLSLSIGMFFSPCVELESYYFTAGAFGWLGILTVSTVYLVVTVAAMITYVALAIEGINRFNFQFLEKNEKAIIGTVLIMVGLASYFVNF